MALLVDLENQQPCVIGVNAKGELGLGDTDSRKTFCVLNEIRDKKIKQCDAGKSGFMIAVSEDVIEPNISENQNEIASSLAVPDSSAFPAQQPRASSRAPRDVQQVHQTAQPRPMSSSRPGQNSEPALPQQETGLNKRIEQLEMQLMKKGAIVRDGDRRHGELLEKI